MGKIRIPIFNEVQIQELENGYRYGKNHALRQRCHIVLLKQQGDSSRHITSLKDYPKHQTTINNWVTRYEKFGIKGLKNKQGQGRKSILNPAIHQQKVEEIVKSERQRLEYAKSLIEKELDVKMNKRTLTRFLRNIKCTYRRIRKSVKQKPDTQLYAVRVERLALLEQQAENEQIDWASPTYSMPMKAVFLNKDIVLTDGNLKTKK